MTPEFSRIQRLDTIGGGARVVEIAADADERAALARRFGLLGLERITARAELTREGDAVIAIGRLEAAVVQPCAASGQPVPAAIAEPFALRFVPEGDAPSAEEMELDANDLDELTYSGGGIDLGEAVAQTLALALDPFPRAPNADTALREAGVVGEEDVGPFAMLKALRDKS